MNPDTNEVGDTVIANNVSIMQQAKFYISC